MRQDAISLEIRRKLMTFVIIIRVSHGDAAPGGGMPPLSSLLPAGLPPFLGQHPITPLHRLSSVLAICALFA